MTTTNVAYRILLSEELPHAIHNERDHRAYVKRVEQLLVLQRRSIAENRYLELLSVLIERYEEEHNDIAAPTPLDALKELMLAKGVSQAELGRMFGSSGIASEVLSGKRAMSKAHIKTLAKHFHVSPSIFM